jgi:hypothetical protein
VHVDAGGYVLDGDKEEVKFAGYISAEDLINTKQYPKESVLLQCRMP